MQAHATETNPPPRLRQGRARHERRDNIVGDRRNGGREGAGSEGGSEMDNFAVRDRFGRFEHQYRIAVGILAQGQDITRVNAVRVIDPGARMPKLGPRPRVGQILAGQTP